MKMAPIVISFLFLPQATSSALAAQITPTRLCEGYGGAPQHSEQPYPGMVWVPGGTFIMGDDEERSEERAAHKVSVSGFWIDRHEVTNAQFAMFVEATGYRTIAERGLDPKERSDLSPELLVPGASVFHQPANLMNLIDIGQWWRFVPGANWRHPTGPDSSIEGKANLPVVDVAYEDARAYAHWLGRELPTEAQWEFAARGGLDGATYAWGEHYYDPVDGWRANSWQGTFPLSDTGEDGYHGSAPVGCFLANGYGLFDMIGNVWEYAADWYLPGHPPASATDPNGPPREVAVNYVEAADPLVVIKGGSWLCAPNFCARYRPAARQPQELSLGASHLGFRTVVTGSPTKEAVHAVPKITR